MSVRLGEHDFAHFVVRAWGVRLWFGSLPICRLLSRSNSWWTRELLACEQINVDLLPRSKNLWAAGWWADNGWHSGPKPRVQDENTKFSLKRQTCWLAQLPEETGAVRLDCGPVRGSNFYMCPKALSGGHTICTASGIGGTTLIKGGQRTESSLRLISDDDDDSLPKNPQI